MQTETAFPVFQIVLISIIFICIALFAFYIYARNYVLQNWDEYRCQPFFMAISGMFGKDPDEENKKCHTANAKKHAKKVIDDSESFSQILNDQMSKLESDVESALSSVEKMNIQHTQTQDTILGVIQNVSGVILFMFEKLKVIVKKLLAVSTAVVYALFTSSNFMKSLIEGPVGSAVAAVRANVCFAGDTMVDMKNGKQKKIRDIKKDDIVAEGGKVMSNLDFDYHSDTIYNYEGILVTGDHVVKHKGEWMKVSKTGAKIEKFTGNKVYCLVTENNVIRCSGHLFLDFFELRNPAIKEEIMLDISACFSGDTAITMEDSNEKMIKDIKIDEIVKEGGKVIAIMKFKNRSETIYNYNNIRVTGDHVVFDTDKWTYIKDTNAEKEPYSEDFVYCLITENNLIRIKQDLFKDYLGVDTPEIREKVIECLTGEKNNVDHNDYYLSGVIEGSLVNGKKVEEIQIGDFINNYGKVLSVVSQRSTGSEYVKLGPIILPKHQILFSRNKEKDWRFAKDVVGAEIIKLDSPVFYSLDTESGLYKVGSRCLLNYSEINNANVSRVEEEHLFK